MRSVIPVATRLAGIVVVSIELYEDGVGVRWLSAPLPVSEEGEGLGVEPLPLQIRDDAGTPYRQVGSGGSGNSAVLRGETLFVPAVSDTATSIDVTLDEGETISVELPVDDGPRPQRDLR